MSADGKGAESLPSLRVVRSTLLIKGVLGRLHPFLLQELLQLRQSHVGVFHFQAREVGLLERRESGFHPALRVAVQVLRRNAETGVLATWNMFLLHLLKPLFYWAVKVGEYLRMVIMLVFHQGSSKVAKCSKDVRKQFFLSPPQNFNLSKIGWGQEICLWMPGERQAMQNTHTRTQTHTIMCIYI